MTRTPLKKCCGPNWRKMRGSGSWCRSGQDSVNEKVQHIGWSAWHGCQALGGQLTKVHPFRSSSMVGWTCRIATSTLMLYPPFAELIQTKSSAVDSLIAAARYDKKPPSMVSKLLQRIRSTVFIRSRSNPIRHCYRPKRWRWKAATICTRGQLIFVQRAFLNQSKVKHGTILLDFVETPEPDLAAAIVQTNHFN